MKTPKQLSEDVLRKISAHKEKQKRIYRNVQRIAAIILIAAVVLPVSLHLTTNRALKDLAPSGNMEAVGNDSVGQINSNNEGLPSIDQDTQTPPSCEISTEKEWTEEFAPYPDLSEEENSKEDIFENETSSAEESGYEESTSDDRTPSP